MKSLTIQRGGAENAEFTLADRSFSGPRRPPFSAEIRRTERRNQARWYNGIKEWENPSESGVMTTILTLDKAGRVVLPKPLRDELELAAGDALELESRGEQIMLRPVRGSAPLQKERGIWVYRTGRPLPAATTDQTLRQIREERDQKNRKAR